MPSTAFSELCCPIDGEPLAPAEQASAWRCSAGHSFDVAKQGYLNLLPVQHKRSKDPGDSKEMIAARRDFLNQGFYQPLAHAIAEQVLTYARQQGTSAEHKCTVLDAGCGEGYYIRQLMTANSNEHLSMVGLDISKWAVLSAAKQGAVAKLQHQTKQEATGSPKVPLEQDNGNTVRWIVATNAHIPVPDESIDVLLCVFGFPVYTEFLRVLKPGGLLLMVDPGPLHLQELRKIIYPELKLEGVEKVEHQSFVARPPTVLHYPLVLESKEQIRNLLAMTPHFFRAPTAGKTRIQEFDNLLLTINVKIQPLLKPSNI